MFTDSGEKKNEDRLGPEIHSLNRYFIYWPCETEDALAGAVWRVDKKAWQCLGSSAQRQSGESLNTSQETPLRGHPRQPPWVPCSASSGPTPACRPMTVRVHVHACTHMCMRESTSGRFLVRQGPRLFRPPETLQGLAWCFIQRTLPPSRAKETFYPLLGGRGGADLVELDFLSMAPLTAQTGGKTQEVTTSQTTMPPPGGERQGQGTRWAGCSAAPTRETGTSPSWSERRPHRLQKHSFPSAFLPLPSSMMRIVSQHLGAREYSFFLSLFPQIYL